MAIFQEDVNEFGILYIKKIIMKKVASRKRKKNGTLKNGAYRVHGQIVIKNE